MFKLAEAFLTQATNNKYKQWVVKLLIIVIIIIITYPILIISTKNSNKILSEITGNIFNQNTPEIATTEDNSLPSAYIQEEIKQLKNNINNLESNIETLKMLVIASLLFTGLLIMLHLWYETRKSEGIIDVMKNAQISIDKNTHLIKIINDTIINKQNEHE